MPTNQYLPTNFLPFQLIKKQSIHCWKTQASTFWTQEVCFGAAAFCFRNDSTLSSIWCAAIKFKMVRGWEPVLDSALIHKSTAALIGNLKVGENVQYCLSTSRNSSGSGTISLDSLLFEDEKSYPQLPWELILPPCLEPLPLSLFTSDELCLQLPWKAALQDLLDDVVRNLPELQLSSLTTFKGFSNALRMYLMRGRLDGLGFRHDLAMIDIAHTSSKRSSSIINDGSTIFVTSSLSWILMLDMVCSNHSFVVASSSLLIPSFPVTSSNNTLPKQ